MDFLKPENLLRYGYKDCLFCVVERKGEDSRCRKCSGRVGQRDRLLWEMNRERRKRRLSRMGFLFPGLGHLFTGRVGVGLFWMSLIPLALGLAIETLSNTGVTWGHIVLIFGSMVVWYFSVIDARRGFVEKFAPCREACPSRVNIPDYLALVREGKEAEALALVHDRLPFAAFCGRACPHPCEQKCVRSEFSAPIAIMHVKRFLADVGYGSGFSPAREEMENPPRIAVIGGGPAGLSAASTLARLGAKVTVFDENEQPGGMMCFGVPVFRFPESALYNDIGVVLKRGVHFEGGKVFGRDVTFAGLERDGFEAVIVAVGTSQAIRLPGTGVEKEGFYDALAFLAAVQRKEPMRVSGKVVVIGGGNVAVDVARTAARLGAREVAMICLESRETMPASSWEVEDALSEGIRLLPAVVTKRFLRDTFGNVCGIEALKVERIDFDEKKRIVPVPVPGSEFELGADMVVMAVGSRAKMDFLSADVVRKPVDPAHHIHQLISKGKEFTIPAYACGDCVRGPGSVVEASASGRKVALNIFEILRVNEVEGARFVDNFQRVGEPQVKDSPEWRVRTRSGRIPPQESRYTFDEVEKRFTSEMAKCEAERCARCNLWI